MSAYHKNALPRGYQLAEYTIESVLGHGGFGVTYLASDSSLGAKVAIKEYLPHQMASRGGNGTKVVPDLNSRSAVQDYQWGLKRFLKEAQALAHFKHPNIVRVLRYMEANGTAYMVMEYEKGESLGHYLRYNGNRIDESAINRYFLPILNGLQQVHTAGMMHFDIKPDNIYIREDGTPMLIDFGSARQAISSQSHGQRTVLTPGYAPIEQYPDKGEQGPWTDLYALGASMYRCITGKRPIESLERYKMVLKLKADPLTPAVKAATGRYPQQLLECVDWALQPYPTDRPKSAREFQERLMGKGVMKETTSKLKIHVPPAAKHARFNFDLAHKLASVGRFLQRIVIILGVTVVIGVIVHYYWPSIASKYPAVGHQWDGLYQKYLKDPLQRLRFLLQNQ